MPRLSARCDASPIHTRGPSSVAARKPRNAPGALSALSTLLAAALLAGCAATQPDRIPERMLTPEAVQEATRQDANGEPYYLSYQVGETGLAAAFDDGSHTYVEFERPVPSDLSCFDNAGALLGCEAVGNVLAVEGTHAGILLRQGENASFIAPNPKALTPPPRQLGNTSAWAAHVQARNRVLLKAPLRQALERSAGVQADPNLNQAAGLRASMVQTVAPAQPGAAQTPTSAADRPGTRLLRHGETPSHRETASHHAHATTNEPGPRARGSLKAERPDGAAAITPGTSARPGKPAGTAPATASGPHNVIVSSSRWTLLPFADNSAQLDARHPVMTRLGKSLTQADEIRVEVLSSAEDALLAQARLAATRELLQRQGVISSRIRTSTRTLPAARSTRQGAATPGQPTLRIQLLKDGLPLEAA